MFTSKKRTLSSHFSLQLLPKSHILGSCYDPCFTSLITLSPTSAPPVGRAFLQPPQAFQLGSFCNLSLIALPSLLGCLIGHKHIPGILCHCELCFLQREFACSMGSKGRIDFVVLTSLRTHIKLFLHLQSS